MRADTRELKKEMERDIRERMDFNHKKNQKASAEYYYNKWKELEKKAKTQAQKEYCKNILSRCESYLK